MSTHTDPDVKATHDAYQAAQNDLVAALYNLADSIPMRLAAFDDDGHMRHLDHATSIASLVYRFFADQHITRLIQAGARADAAIHQARTAKDQP